MATKKKATSMQSEDAAFFRNAYKNNPAARKSIEAEMKKRGLSAEAVFGKKKPATKKK